MAWITGSNAIHILKMYMDPEGDVQKTLHRNGYQLHVNEFGEHRGSDLRAEELNIQLHNAIKEVVKHNHGDCKEDMSMEEGSRLVLETIKHLGVETFSKECTDAFMAPDWMKVYPSKIKVTISEDHPMRNDNRRLYYCYDDLVAMVCVNMGEGVLNYKFDGRELIGRDIGRACRFLDSLTKYVRVYESCGFPKLFEVDDTDLLKYTGMAQDITNVISVLDTRPSTD